jgi:hypothetical protein
VKNELGSPVQIRGESDTKYLCSIWGMYFGQGCSALDVLSRPDMQPFGATESRRIIINAVAMHTAANSSGRWISHVPCRGIVLAQYGTRQFYEEQGFQKEGNGGPNQ